MFEDFFNVIQLVSFVWSVEAVINFLQRLLETQYVSSFPSHIVIAVERISDVNVILYLALRSDFGLVLKDKSIVEAKVFNELRNIGILIQVSHTINK